MARFLDSSQSLGKIKLGTRALSDGKSLWPRENRAGPVLKKQCSYQDFIENDIKNISNNIIEIDIGDSGHFWQKNLKCSECFVRISKQSGSAAFCIVV